MGATATTVARASSSDKLQRQTDYPRVRSLHSLVYGYHNISNQERYARWCSDKWCRGWTRHRGLLLRFGQKNKFEEVSRLAPLSPDALPLHHFSKTPWTLSNLWKWTKCFYDLSLQSWMHLGNHGHHLWKKYIESVFRKGPHSLDEHEVSETIALTSVSLGIRRRWVFHLKTNAGVELYHCLLHTDGRNCMNRTTWRNSIRFNVPILSVLF